MFIHPKRLKYLQPVGIAIPASSLGPEQIGADFYCCYPLSTAPGKAAFTAAIALFQSRSAGKPCDDENIEAIAIFAATLKSSCIRAGIDKAFERGRN